MKIAVIGNQNNNNFVVTRYLRDAGLDAQLCLLNNEDEFYHPKADTYDTDYGSFITSFEWGNYHNFNTTEKKLILKDLKEFDFLIGVGTVPAFVNKAGLKLDIFIACGGDIDTYPFLFKLINFKKLYATLKGLRKRKQENNKVKVNLPNTKKIYNPLALFYNYYQFSKNQRTGIENTSTLLFDSVNSKFEAIVQKLRKKSDRIVCAPPMLYTKMYTKEIFENNLDVLNHENYKLACKLKKENDFLVLHYCRHAWLNAPNWVGNKGNDILIKGFKQFVIENPKVKTHLILYDIGIDVKETKNLIKKLNIENRITWFPASNRKFVMPIISQADVVIGQLKNSWLTYGIVLETLCMKKPLIHNRDDSSFKNSYDWLYPMISAGSLDEINKALKAVSSDKEIHLKNAELAYDWLKEFCIDKSIYEIIKRIKEKNNND